MSDQTTPVEETLAWEAEHRRTASAGSVVGGLALLVGVVIQTLVLGGAPRVALLTALQKANSIEHADLRLPGFAYISDHGGALLFSAVLQGGGYAAAMFGVGFLFRATHARRPALKRWVLIVVLIGLGLLAVSTVLGGVGLVSKAHSFVHGTDHGHHAANQVLVDNAFVRDASILQYVAAVLFAAGVVMLSLNAMRSGLLTKFLGYLGVISGVLYIIVFGTPLHAFPFIIWMASLGVLFGGHWPNGVPAAWASGKEEPWPTAAEVRAQRDAARGRTRGDSAPRQSRASKTPAAPPPDSRPAAPTTSVPHSSSKKRKRKRR
jgi:hypothetical protein